LINSTTQCVNQPIIVAHRGFAAEYPENTLIAFQQAIVTGARCIEIDVQLTKDHCAVVIHDADLHRTAGCKKKVSTALWDEIAPIPVGEPARFGDQFSDEKLLTLNQFVEFLNSHTTVQAFIEIKEESIHQFGVAVVMEEVLSILAPVKQQCVIISYVESTLIYARQQSAMAIGWVLTHYDEASKKRATQLQPEYLICNYRKLPDVSSVLWPGQWQWMLYEVIDVNLAWTWFQRGVNYIETMEVNRMVSGLKRHAK